MAAVCVTTAEPAHASTVLPLTVEQLADATAQVIDGVVASTECFWSDDGTRILTRVRFTGVSYHKGCLPESSDTLELSVPGGVVGEASLRITDAPRFEPGQRWLLFLHATYNVHPVVGLHRGAFRIIADSDDRLTMHAASGAAIAGFDETGLPVLAPGTTADPEAPKPRCVLGGTSGAVVGVRPLQQSAEQAMTLDEFLDRIRPVLAASKDHTLRAPADRAYDRRAPAPVPLRIRSFQPTPRKSSGRIGDRIKPSLRTKEQRRGR